MSIKSVETTDPANGRAEPAEILTAEDLSAMLADACGSRDLAVVGATDHRGFGVLIPSGFVRINLTFGSHVAARRQCDGAPSDQYPVLPLHRAVPVGHGFHEVVTGD